MYPRGKLIFSELKEKKIEDESILVWTMEYDSSEVLNLLREGKSRTNKNVFFN
jgi:hypothetical protein